MGLYDQLMKSNMSSGSKNDVLSKVFAGISETGVDRVKSHALASGHALRSGGETLLVSAGLAALHVELKGGLDVPVPIPGQPGKTYQIPIDGVVALAGIVGSVALSNDSSGVSADLRHAGNAALAVVTFRKTFDFMAAKKRLAGGVVGGTFAGEDGSLDREEAPANADPVVAKARLIEARRKTA